MMGELRDFLGHLMNHEHNDGDSFTWSDAESLSENESDDWRSMGAEKSRLDKLVERLRDEAKVLEARRTIFWFKLRLNHKLTDVNALRIDEERMLVQSGQSKE